MFHFHVKLLLLIECKAGSWRWSLWDVVKAAGSRLHRLLFLPRHQRTTVYWEFYSSTTR